MTNKPVIAWKVSYSDPTIASVRYRCLIPIRHLRGYVSRFYARNDPINFNEPLAALILVKSFTDHDVKLALEAKRRGVPLYVDLCDNLFDRPAKQIPRKDEVGRKTIENFVTVARVSDGVITTGDVLAERLRVAIGETVPIYVIPDSLDDAEDSRFAQMTCANQRREWMLAHGRKWIVTRVIPRAVKSMLRALVTRPIHVIRIVLNHLHIFSKPVEKRVQSEPTSIIRASETEARPVPDDVPRLLWFGHSGIPGASGLTDLQLIAEPLAALSRTRRFVVVVVSNNYERYLKYVKPLPFPSVYEDWSMDGIADQIRSCDVTLVPNPLNRFSLMKSANRTILSLHHGVPVVATRTPALAPFEGCVVFDDWESGISRYLDSPEAVDRDVEAGRRVVREQFSGEAIAEQWSRLVRKELPPLFAGRPS